MSIKPFQATAKSGPHLNGSALASRKEIMWKIARLVFASLLLALAIYVLVNPYLIGRHQQEMTYYRNPSRLQIKGRLYAREGIVLLLRTTSPVVDVMRQQKIPFFPFWKVEFRAFSLSQEMLVVIAAAYTFSPDAEWYLECLNADGYWDYAAWYFTERPEITDLEWTNIWQGRSLPNPSTFRGPGGQELPANKDAGAD